MLLQSAIGNSPGVLSRFEVEGDVEAEMNHDTR